MAAGPAQVPSNTKVPWPRVPVESWADYQDKIEPYLDGGWLFRGVTSVRHDLIPSVGRGGGGLAYSPAIESDLFDQFTREAIPLLPSRPQSRWEWLALAQHFGVPTRLLDWSESPYVALFFAVWGSEDEDAGLFIVPRPHGRSDALPDDPFQTDEVRFFYPGYVTPRLVSQRGLFTIHPDPASRYVPPRMVQLVLPRDSKASFRRKLDTIGTHHAAIFPDLDGLARRLVAVQGFRHQPPQPNVAGQAAGTRSPEEEVKPRVNPLDPQKGQWGRRPARDGWRLSAKVREAGPGWFDVKLEVGSDRVGAKPLTEPVTFHLHDSFEKMVRKVRPARGRAKLNLVSYGAFTVGAVIGPDGPELELDLAELPSAPRKFRER